MSGKLVYNTDVNTRLTAATVQIRPDGSLEIGTATNPIAPTVQAEMVFKDRPLDVRGLRTTKITAAGATATVEMATPHGLQTGECVLVWGSHKNVFDGVFPATVTGPTTFTYPMTTAGNRTARPAPGEELLIGVGYDLFQVGTGFIGEGDIMVHGIPKAPWARLAAAPKKGESILKVTDPGRLVGWRTGDRLALPDTAPPAPGQTWDKNEVITLAAPPSSITLSLKETLQYDHPGSLDDGLGSITPTIANLTRNVTFRPATANPAVPPHMMFPSGAKVSLHYLRIQNFGRTRLDIPSDRPDLDTLNPKTGLPFANHIGRYPVHFHHIDHLPKGMLHPLFTHNSKQYRALVRGIVIEGSSNGGVSRHDTGYDHPRWGVVLHKSSHIGVLDNVLYRLAGSAIMLEDGDEYGNTIQGNWISAISGSQEPLYQRRNSGEERNNIRGDFGHEGSGIWLRNPTSIVEDNNISNTERFGIVMANIALGTARDGEVLVPLNVASSNFTRINMHSVPINVLGNNEVFASERGISFWEVGAKKPDTDKYEAVRSIDGRAGELSGFVAWNFRLQGVEIKHSSSIDVTGARIIGNLRNGQAGISLRSEANLVGHIRVSHSRIVGSGTGITAPGMAGSVGEVQGTFEVRDTVMNNKTDISIPHPGAMSGDGAILSPRLTLISNILFPDIFKGLRRYTIALLPPSSSSSAIRETLEVPDWIFATSYNGNTSDDFRVYYPDQKSVPYGKEFAPQDATARKEIQGLVIQTK